MKELTLPSGKQAVIKDGHGRDLIAAQRVASSSDEIGQALIAQLTEIDGKPIVLEDVLDMDIADVLALQGELMGEINRSPQPSTLSISATPQGGA